MLESTLTPMLAGFLLALTKSWIGISITTLLILYYFRRDVVALLPSVNVEEHDIHSRLMMAYFARELCHLSNYKATLYADPRSLNMARFFQIANDPLPDNDINTGKMMYFFPLGLVPFWKGHLFILSTDGLTLSVLWYNNKPIKEFFGATTNKYLLDGKLQHWTSIGDDWNLQARAKRPLSTYHSDKLSDIMRDTKKFFENEKKYSEQGTKWKHVYLFHGPMGTGKSALCDVLASEIDVSLYRISAAASDAEFHRLINTIDKGSIVVLEELTSLKSSLSGDVDSNARRTEPIHRQSLLSWLSGEIGVEGVVIILTLNDLDMLDKTVIRERRVDQIVHFQAEMTRDAVRGILECRFPDKFADGTPDIKLNNETYSGCTPAQFHQYLDGKEFETAVEGLHEWLVQGANEQGGDKGR